MKKLERAWTSEEVGWSEYGRSVRTQPWPLPLLLPLAPLKRPLHRFEGRYVPPHRLRPLNDCKRSGRVAACCCRCYYYCLAKIDGQRALPLFRRLVVIVVVVVGCHHELDSALLKMDRRIFILMRLPSWQLSFHYFYSSPFAPPQLPAGFLQ